MSRKNSVKKNKVSVEWCETQMDGVKFTMLPPASSILIVN